MKQKITKKVFIALNIVLFIAILFSVKVYASDTSFSLEEEIVEVKLNGKKYIAYTGGSGTITYSSSDDDIVTVDNTGYATGKNIGEATITATRGAETDTCKVKVVYNTLTIGGNSGKSVLSVNLILSEHETETLTATVEDYNYAEVSNAKITWKSSDTSIVTVNENTGELKALKEGKVTITATAAGVSDTCEVSVYGAPKFTDFSKAKFQNEISYTEESLKISGITPAENGSYYYVVTPTKTKPNLVLSGGMIDSSIEGQDFNLLTINTKDNYVYTRNLAKYTELNQELYLWVIQQVSLEEYYYDSNSKYVSHASRFVVEGEKLTRAQLPNLNLILKSFTIGEWTYSNDSANYTSINFNFPTHTEKRKFTLKIGKVTDNKILTKIQKGDYTGITELLSYAKKNESVYSKELTTTTRGFYRNDKAIFDGNKLLKNKAYYYIYLQFNDENGKYAPIEGVTLGQAILSSTNNNWDLWAYTADNFEWDNLTPTTPETDKKDEVKEENIDKEENTEKEEKDDTVSDVKLPNTGKQIIISSIIVLLAISGILMYKKYNQYKGI